MEYQLWKSKITTTTEPRSLHDKKVQVIDCNSVGNPTQTVDNTGTTSWSYNAAGRLVSVTAAGKTTTYGYDANGDLTSQITDH
ncbi:MAG: RHS repeat protein [Abditibacteriales bacterium]|nr:RHS repeat protein [Abditibacteriales bacterium]